MYPNDEELRAYSMTLMWVSLCTCTLPVQLEVRQGWLHRLCCALEAAELLPIQSGDPLLLMPAISSQLRSLIGSRLQEGFVQCRKT